VAAGTFLLVFAGVLSALQLDHYLSSKRLPEIKYSDRPGVQINNAEYQSGPISFDFREAAKKVTPSVVSIDTLAQMENWFGERFTAPSGSGSGVVISANGYILTNNHVVADATEVRVGLLDGRTLEAHIVGRDPKSDLAVLKVAADNLKPIEFGKSDDLQPGEWVIAVGNPLGFSHTVSVGVVSSIGRTLPTQASVLVDAIQTDAAINPGNSGGALCNAAGQLVGINTAIASRTGGSEGIGFAIPTSRAKRVVDDIRNFGRVKYGELGLTTVDRTGLLQSGPVRRRLQQVLNSPSEPPSEGLLIDAVVTGSPASKAGIGKYSILLALDGKKMSDPVEYRKVMIDKRPGDKIKVQFWSVGKTEDKTLTLEDIGD